jgi:hypothetical protein
LQTSKTEAKAFTTEDTEEPQRKAKTKNKSITTEAAEDHGGKTETGKA